MRPEGEPRPRHDHPRWWLVVAGLAAVAAFVAHDRLLGLDTYYGLFGNKVDAEVYRYGGPHRPPRPACAGSSSATSTPPAPVS
ncbi:hypothetical protein [Rhodococcus yananensis]|uniref:hypothetical protein n=1 Tax=Rhodococcus yananensis TaxID=2879464 RepID=UPI001CF8391C|nr:hypothetical protein [Rhodococcus yananensis]